MIVEVYLNERLIAVLRVASEATDRETCIALAKGILRLEEQPEEDIEAADYVIREE